MLNELGAPVKHAVQLKPVGEFAVHLELAGGQGEKSAPSGWSHFNTCVCVWGRVALWLQSQGEYSSLQRDSG